MTIDTNYVATDHSIPAAAGSIGLTSFAMAVHDPGMTMWSSGKPVTLAASDAAKDSLAGVKSEFNDNSDQVQVFKIVGVDNTGTQQVSLNTDGEGGVFSAVMGILPTALKRFTGVDSEDLCDPETGKWVKTITAPLVAYIEGADGTATKDPQDSKPYGKVTLTITKNPDDAPPPAAPAAAPAGKA